MNAVATLEGRRLNAKLTDGWLADVSAHARRTDAEHGSLMLKNAILRAKGYTVPEPLVVAAPAFKLRNIKRGARENKRAYRPDTKVAEIQVLVASHFGMRADDLVSTKRSYTISHPRQIAMYLARKAAGVSYPSIGKQFGGKDHSTVIHAVREVEKRIAGGHVETLEALNAVHAVIGS